MIEQLHFNDMLDSSALLDSAKGTLNRAATLVRLQEELFRATDFSIPMSLCLLKIDQYIINEAPIDFLDELTCHVVSVIKRNIRVYDVVGEVEDGVLALILSGYTAQEGQLLGERIRKETAVSIIEVDSKRFTVTVSMGVTQARSRDSMEMLLSNSYKALDAALSKANTVTVFD